MERTFTPQRNPLASSPSPITMANADPNMLLPINPVALQPAANFNPSAEIAAIPIFYGDAKVDKGEASAWLQAINRHVVMCGHNARQAINFAVQRLGGGARDWFYHVALRSPRDYDAHRMETDYEYWQERFLLRYASLRSVKDPCQTLDGLSQRPQESAERYLIRLQAAYSDFEERSRRRTLAALAAREGPSFIRPAAQAEIDDMGLNQANTARVVDLLIQEVREGVREGIIERSADTSYEAVALHAIRTCTQERIKTLIRKRMFDADINTPSKLADLCREEELAHTNPTFSAGNARSFGNYGQDGNRNVVNSAEQAEDDSQEEADVNAAGYSNAGRGRGRGRGRGARGGRGGRGGGAPPAGQGAGGESDSKKQMWCPVCKRASHDFEECRTFKAMQEQFVPRGGRGGKKRGAGRGGAQPPNGVSSGTGDQQQQQQQPQQGQQQQQMPPPPPPNDPMAAHMAYLQQQQQMGFPSYPPPSLAPIQQFNPSLGPFQQKHF